MPSTCAVSCKGLLTRPVQKSAAHVAASLINWCGYLLKMTSGAALLAAIAAPLYFHQAALSLERRTLSNALNQVRVCTMRALWDLESRICALLICDTVSQDAIGST